MLVTVTVRMQIRLPKCMLFCIYETQLTKIMILVKGLKIGHAVTYSLGQTWIRSKGFYMYFSYVLSTLQSTLLLLCVPHTFLIDQFNLCTKITLSNTLSQYITMSVRPRRKLCSSSRKYVLTYESFDYASTITWWGFPTTIFSDAKQKNMDK